MEGTNLIGSVIKVRGRSGWFNRATFHRGIRLALLLLAAVMLAAAALFGDQPVQGQTTSTLVSNTGQGISTFGPAELGSERNAYGQVFTTGSDVTEYRLDSIGIAFATIHASADPTSELTVTLNDADVVSSAKKANDIVLCTLTNPATFTANGVNRFDAPTSGDLCPLLKSETDYAVVITRANSNTHEITLPLADSTTEDTLTPSTGWTIYNNPDFVAGPDFPTPTLIGDWITDARPPLVIEVKGAIIHPQLTTEITGFTAQSQGWNRAVFNVTVASAGDVYIRWRPKSETSFGDNKVSGEPDADNKAVLVVNEFTHGVRYVVQASQDESFSDPAQLEFTHDWNTIVRDVEAVEVTFTTALLKVTIVPDDDVVDLWVLWRLPDPEASWNNKRLSIPANTSSITTLVEDLPMGTTYVLEVFPNTPAHRFPFYKFPRASFTTPVAAVFSRASLTIDEGESDTYTLALGTEPTAPVTISLSTDGAVTTQPTSLRFTPSNWDMPQTVSVNANHDNNASDDVVTITHTVTSNSAAEYVALANLADVRVAVLDDDIPPPAVRGFIAADESQNAVALSWWSERDAAEYEVEYRRQGDSGNWTRITRGDFDHRPSTSSNRTLSAIATGLDCNTAYDFRIRLRGSGNGILDAFGPHTQVSHSTGECAQPDKASNLMYTLAPDCATLTWTAPTGGDYTGVRIRRLTLGDDNYTVIHESLNSRPTSYRDCTHTGDGYGDGDNPWYAYRVTYIKSGSRGIVESKPARSGLDQYGPAFQDHLHAPPRNVRLTRDTDSQRRMTWEAPPSWSLTTWAGLQGQSVPVPDPWITGYVVERREFGARADGYLYFSDAEEDLSLWNATMTVGQSSNDTRVGYSRESANHFGSLSPDTFNHVAGRYRVLDFWYQLDRLQLTVDGVPPAHAAGDWDLVINGARFSLADALISPSSGFTTISWVGTTLSWTNGQQVSLQLVDRDRYEWKTVREGNDGDTTTSFTDNEQANGRKFVYRVRTTNRYGASTTHAIFDWLWDSPYRDAVIDLAATDTTTDDEASGNTGGGSANTPASGAPTIDGTPRVGETLTASTSAISDEDGLTQVSYSYQWNRNNAGISGATASTYTLTASDQGATLTVRVAFTDDEGNGESLTSAATGAVLPPAPLTATFPVSPYQSARHTGTDDRPQVIVAFSRPVASFKKTTPSVSLTGAAVSSVRRHQENGLENAWIFFLNPDGTDDIVLNLLTGQSCDSGGICTDDGRTLSSAVQTTLPGPDEETEPENPTLDDPNSPASGAPTISGTPQVEQTLTADTSNIDDEDGLDDVAYSYQWLSAGTAISGATSSSYTLTANEQGETIQVRVDFEDDQGNAETLTSVATEAVAAKPAPLTASFSNVPSSHDGSATLTFRVLFSEDIGISYVNMRDDAFSLDDGDVTTARRVDGQSDLWEITVEPDDNSDVVITLPANRSCTTAGAICTREDTPRQLTNSPSATVPGPSDQSSSDTTDDTTEEPTVTSQLSVADATASEEDDATIDFVVTLNPAGEASITVDYATANGTASAGSDYTAQSRTLTFTAGETSQTVTVAIIDDTTEENDETLTLTLSNPSGAEISDGQATGTITDSEPAPLTASFSNVPDSHDGSTEFTFTLTFSENFPLSYRTLRDHAFTKDAQNEDHVVAAQRKVPGSNQTWTITVKPPGNSTMTITLPETTDCDATGTICTSDGRMLSHSTLVSVAGPS